MDRLEHLAGLFRLPSAPYGADIQKVDHSQSLIKYRKQFYPVAEMLRHDAGVFLEPLHNGAVEKSSFTVKLYGHIPMEQCYQRLHADLQKPVD